MKLTLRKSQSYASRALDCAYRCSPTTFNFAIKRWIKLQTLKQHSRSVDVSPFDSTCRWPPFKSNSFHVLCRKILCAAVCTWHCGRRKRRGRCGQDVLDVVLLSHLTMFRTPRLKLHRTRSWISDARWSSMGSDTNAKASKRSYCENGLYRRVHICSSKHGSYSDCCSTYVVVMYSNAV